MVTPTGARAQEAATPARLVSPSRMKLYTPDDPETIAKLREARKAAHGASGGIDPATERLLEEAAKVVEARKAAHGASGGGGPSSAHHRRGLTGLQLSPAADFLGGAKVPPDRGPLSPDGVDVDFSDAGFENFSGAMVPTEGRPQGGSGEPQTTTPPVPGSTAFQDQGSGKDTVSRGSSFFRK